MKKNKKTNLLFVISLFFISFTFFNISVSAEPKCRANETQDQCNTRLRAEIAKKEAEIKRLQGDIRKENGKQSSLSSEIAKLRREIKNTESSIHKKNTIIARIGSEIKNKEKSLKQLNDKLKREKESLEKILRKRYEIGDTTLFEFILSKKTISDYYRDIPDFLFIQSALSRSFKKIADIKYNIYGEKTVLEKKKKDEKNAKYSLTLEKGRRESQKKERDLALKVSKSKEASLAALKKKREEEIKKIRSALIRFQGNGISRSISFGEAYDYAKLASRKTGVRTAFIMAIMQQESGFGNNVGGCYLKNGETGEGIYIKSGNKSMRNMVPGHFAAFKRITASLGRDWKTTPISCAVYQNGSYYGYGGAMGYTQFIPGTWDLVAPRIRAYLGVQVANPWNARDAVMATAIFMKDKGATAQTYSTEYNAACRYYGSCSRYNYGASVLSKAARIQQKINTIERK